MLEDLKILLGIDRYAIGVFEGLFIPETFSLGGVTV